MTTELHGWGLYPIIKAEAKSVRTSSETAALLKDSSIPSLIARGLGRSYGDSALALHVADMTGLHLLLEFDSKRGLLRCGAGASLADILRVIVPQGWFLPVTPGTQFVTVGGAIASDVHGKNHHQVGSFSTCVESFEIMLATGDRITCSRQQNADLFWATCGGMGLTGVILQATLKLHPITSSSIRQTTYKAAHLEELLLLMKKHKSATYSVAWIDCLAGKGDIGRGLLMVGEHAEEGSLQWPDPSRFSIPCFAPSWALNSWNIQIFNSLYYHRAASLSTVSQKAFGFFYPLDQIQHWNRLYGRKGFVQYQCVIPLAMGEEGLTTLLNKISQERRGSFLAVLKQLGSQNEGPLSFAQEGYTLALDFKIEPGLFEFLDTLDTILLEYGGRLYLAKDSRMSAATFQRGYRRWEEFQAVREKYGALKKFNSLQAQRLGLGA